MKIAVIGGSGLIGTKVVTKLVSTAIMSRRHHPARASTPSPAKDWPTCLRAPGRRRRGELPLLRGGSRDGVLRDGGRNLLPAEKAAGVEHHVALSVVGTERLVKSGYFRAKMAQEKLIKESGIPYSIVRATQFFEFVRTSPLLYRRQTDPAAPY